MQLHHKVMHNERLVPCQVCVPTGDKRSMLVKVERKSVDPIAFAIIMNYDTVWNLEYLSPLCLLACQGSCKRTKY